MGTAALSERDYVHEAIDRADVIIAIGHDTVEKPPFIMGPDGPRSSTSATRQPKWNRSISRTQSWSATSAPASPSSPTGSTGRLPNASALLHLRDGILRRTTARATEDRFPMTPQRIVADVRAGDAGRRHRHPGQRHVQDLVRPELPPPLSPTRCCWTTRSPPWAPACHRR